MFTGLYIIELVDTFQKVQNFTMMISNNLYTYPDYCVKSTAGGFQKVYSLQRGCIGT